jgi:hypothetical protein
MGREIRKVPKGWEHPVDERGRFKPLYDRTFNEDAEEWWQDAVNWQSGKYPDWTPEDSKAEHRWYWTYGGNPPDPESYRPEWDRPADCFQIYETVSEGTPCSPVFETIASMVDWMTEPIDRASPYNLGQDWQCMQGMTREQAEAFCGRGFAPSLIVTAKDGVVPGHLLP